MEEKTFDYALAIYHFSEALGIAREKNLKKEDVKICVHVSDIVGFHFPTKKLLLIMPELHYEAIRRGILK